MTGLEAIAERHRKAREAPEPLTLPTLRTAGEYASKPLLRLHTRMPVLEAATGGGFVRGAVYMLHGEPGAGKSTLIGQGAGLMPRSVYVSAEESAVMLGARMIRLGYPDQLIVEESDTANALRLCGAASFIVIDSISAMKGRDSAELIVKHARQNQCAIVIVCHETKGGQHAGPRALEHLIDCTLKLWRQPRVLVVEKNRFGPAPLAWELEMTEKGFR